MAIELSRLAVSIFLLLWILLPPPSQNTRGILICTRVLSPEIKLVKKKRKKRFFFCFFSALFCAVVIVVSVILHVEDIF